MTEGKEGQKTPENELEPKLSDEAVEDLELEKGDGEAVKGGDIGSQSSGAGAGKITFNPFSITR